MLVDLGLDSQNLDLEICISSSQTIKLLVILLGGFSLELV